MEGSHSPCNKCVSFRVNIAKLPSNCVWPWSVVINHLYHVSRRQSTRRIKPDMLRDIQILSRSCRPPDHLPTLPGLRRAVKLSFSNTVIW
jgi:hypothetical protein